LSASIAIDASTGLSWVHPAQATAEASALLSEIASGAEVIVPSLWFTEMANALLILERRNKLTSDERRQALTRLEELNFSIDDADPRLAFAAVSDLAAECGLSVYDATYLELALRKKLRLATRDDGLKRAAKQCGVKIFSRRA
jgi:predicted nucleic acid-binding protein